MSSNDIWTGELAQAAKCLLHKRKDLNLTPRIYAKILGMVSAAFVIPALGTWKQGVPWEVPGQWKPRLKNQI